MPTDPAPTVISSTNPPGYWRQKKWMRNGVYALGTIAILYGMIYWDVVSRAKESYLEGEKYWRWHEHPEEKIADLEKKFEKSKADLEKKLAKNKIKKNEYDRQLEILEFDRKQQLEESSIKYAFVWYQTAYELFSPPKSKWVKLAREKAPLAKEKWKQELREKKIPFEEYMLE